MKHKTKERGGVMYLEQALHTILKMFEREIGTPIANHDLHCKNSDGLPKIGFNPTYASVSLRALAETYGCPLSHQRLYELEAFLEDVSAKLACITRHAWNTIKPPCSFPALAHEIIDSFEWGYSYTQVLQDGVALSQMILETLLEILKKGERERPERQKEYSDLRERIRRIRPEQGFG